MECYKLTKRDGISSFDEARAALIGHLREKLGIEVIGDLYAASRTDQKTLLYLDGILVSVPLDSSNRELIIGVRSPLRARLITPEGSPAIEKLFAPEGYEITKT